MILPNLISLYLHFTEIEISSALEWFNRRKQNEY